MVVACFAITISWGFWENRYPTKKGIKKMKKGVKKMLTGVKPEVRGQRSEVRKKKVSGVRCQGSLYNTIFQKRNVFRTFFTTII